MKRREQFSIRSECTQRVHALLSAPLQAVQPMSAHEWHDLLSREARHRRIAELLAGPPADPEQQHSLPEPLDLTAAFHRFTRPSRSNAQIVQESSL